MRHAPDEDAPRPSLDGQTADTGRRPAADSPVRRGVRTGRRPGPSDTRDRILAEARRLFGERGYERTTIRSVARAADVDPALVHHYYGSKDELLEAALTLPVDTRARIPAVIAGGPGGLGERATRAFLELWEDESIRPVYLGIARCAASHERAAAMMRAVVGRQVLDPIVETLRLPDAQLRANLVASQFIGLAMARYLTRLEPLASSDLETVVAAIAPTIERYLLGDLSRSATASRPSPSRAASPHSLRRRGPRDPDCRDLHHPRRPDPRTQRPDQVGTGERRPPGPRKNDEQGPPS